MAIIKLTSEWVEVFLHSASRFPTDLAPKVLQEAIAAADAADTDFVNAEDAASDAKFDEPTAQAEYQQAAEINVRTGKPLPSHDAVEVAAIKVKVTAEDAVKAKRVQVRALYALSQVLGDESVAGEWRKAVEDKTAALQKELAVQVANIEPLVGKVGQMLAMQGYLGDLGIVNYPTALGGDAVASLRALATAPAWSPAPKQQNIAHSI